MPEALQETLYRLVQESLSNAVRHGAPSRDRIGGAGDGWPGRATRSPTTVEAPPASASVPRFGLIGMRERVAAFGGELVIEPGVSATAGTG